MSIIYEYINALVLLAPFAVQQIIFNIAKLIFKKTRREKLYTVCYFITIALLLIFLKCVFWNAIPSDEPYFILMYFYMPLLKWLPSFIAITISCIVRNISAARKRKAKAKELSENTNDTVSETVEQIDQSI